jgi:hypothetical protein
MIEFCGCVDFRNQPKSTMTCVWDSILKALKFETKVTPSRFCGYLILHNCLTPDVTVNDEKITSKQLEENFMHISALDPEQIGEGYLCSTFDPLLILVCQLFKTAIVHNYLRKHQIIYRSSKNTTNKTITLNSDKGHMTS